MDGRREGRGLDFFTLKFTTMPRQDIFFDVFSAMDEEDRYGLNEQTGGESPWFEEEE